MLRKKKEQPSGWDAAYKAMSKSDKKTERLCDWLEEMADGEAIEAVVIGGGTDFEVSSIPKFYDQPQGVVLSWKQAKPWLKYRFCSGFGSVRCNAVYAWTKSWVIMVEQYDGATGPFKVPRNPVDIMPEMPGKVYPDDY